MGKTLYEKIFDKHRVLSSDDTHLIYIDRHLIHEVTSPQAFEGLKINNRQLWRKESIVAVPDHNVPTMSRDEGIKDPVSKIQVDTLNENCQTHNLLQFKMSAAASLRCKKRPSSCKSPPRVSGRATCMTCRSPKRRPITAQHWQR